MHPNPWSRVPHFPRAGQTIPKTVDYLCVGDSRSPYPKSRSDMKMYKSFAPILVPEQMMLLLGYPRFSPLKSVPLALACKPNRRTRVSFRKNQSLL